jgi:hypothetical protein
VANLKLIHGRSEDALFGRTVLDVSVDSLFNFNGGVERKIYFLTQFRVLLGHLRQDSDNFAVLLQDLLENGLHSEMNNYKQAHNHLSKLLTISSIKSLPLFSKSLYLIPVVSLNPVTLSRSASPLLGSSGKA